MQNVLWMNIMFAPFSTRSYRRKHTENEIELSALPVLGGGEVLGKGVLCHAHGFVLFLWTFSKIQRRFLREQSDKATIQYN